MNLIDTHIHLDGQEFDTDRDAVIERARAAGIQKMLLPAIDLSSAKAIQDLCNRYPSFLYPMIGLHPEEVKPDFRDVLQTMKGMIDGSFVAVGEVGLDFYWSREFEKEQLEAFETQVQWSVETRLPLMIHCRKAQNELVKILRRYEKDLPGGVFHCFAGNEIEATELLSFNNFVLGIGGILTFKKSKLPEVLPNAVPVHRIVLETDAPYMAPTPMRGKRNESSYLVHVIEKMAEIYHVDVVEMAEITTQNALNVFQFKS